MPPIEADYEPIYVFQIEDIYYFKHYFTREDIFAELQDYYNGEEYRFELPEEDFGQIRNYLKENFYQPILVDDMEEFSVVKEQYTEHSDILRNSVMNWSRSGYNFFVMKDPVSVDQAIEKGATPIEETNLALGL